MLLGLMNNPARDPLKEIARIADNGFDFVDLTLEPPGARADQINPALIRAALQARNLSVVGHTAYYLPFAPRLMPCRPEPSPRLSAVCLFSPTSARA
jgi:sugar phosphate isomerase/epimerase